MSRGITKTIGVFESDVVEAIYEGRLNLTLILAELAQAPEFSIIQHDEYADGTPTQRAYQSAAGLACLYEKMAARRLGDPYKGEDT